MTQDRSPSTFGRLFLFAMVLTVAAGVVEAQTCVEYEPPAMHDSTISCVGDPRYQRSMVITRFMWNGSSYAVNDIGNDLKIFRIDSPLGWSLTDTSAFRITLNTDDDENLKDVSVCDDCRYGVAGFGVEGVVLFDLGSGGSPRFTNKAQYSHKPVSAFVNGGFTYKHNGVQYLMATAVTSGCTASGLYRFDSINMDAGDLIQCVTTASGGSLDVSAGAYIESSTGTYLYVVGYGQVQIFRVGQSGQDLTHLGAFAAASGSAAFDVDLDTMLAVTADSSRIHLWDISDPANPYELWGGVPSGDSGMYTTAAIRYPMLFAGKAGRIDSGPVAHLLNITSLTSPVEVDTEIWDKANDWNTLTGCVKNQDATFSDDASVVYLARYSVTQAFDIGSCVDTAPRAGVGVSPASAFPGDVVSVSNASAGSFTRWAIWVEDNAGTIVAGSDQLSTSTPSSRTYAVPASLAESTSLTAYVAVESDQYPYNATAPGEQLASRAITLDRTPTVSITVAPEAPITGDTVTLTASAEGNPDSYQWDIVTPTGAGCPTSHPTCTATGASIQVPLAASGDWAFDLTASYLHTVGGGLYQTTASANRTVSSVAAAFSVSPPAPKHNQTITLTSTSNVAAGVVPAYSWSVSGPSSYTGCPSAATCQIPAETLTPGLYTFSLTVTNPANSDSDTAFKSVNVADGSVQLGFTWFPPNPGIGDPVNFTLQGVSGIDSATWSFGGNGCSGFSNPFTCTPGLGETCSSHVHQYASAGAKTVSVSVVVDGATFGPVSKSLTVQNTGQCGGQSCTYSISPTSRAIGTDGGSGTVSVTAGSSCSWTASPTGGTSSWVTITSGTSGSGNGSVGYSVAANSGAARTGYLTIAGKTFTINQSGTGGSTFDVQIQPNNPQIGQTVQYTVTGFSSEVTSAVFNFGGAGCDNAAAVFNCTPSQFESCLSALHRYSSAGTKTVQVTLNGTAGPTKTVSVQNAGSCNPCSAESKPDAIIAASSTAPALGDTVNFTAVDPTSAATLGGTVLVAGDGGATAQEATAVAITPFPPNGADIGQVVSFTLSGQPSFDQAQWDFGADGCGNYAQQVTCNVGEFGATCITQTHKFAVAGTHTVRVTLKNGTSTVGTATRAYTINNAGSCGGTSCSYSVSPTNVSYPAAGGSGSIGVTATSGCDWTATTSTSWLHITAGGSGSGAGSVAYTVDANTGGSRTGTLVVAGRTVIVAQDAADGGGGGGSAADSWSWRVRHNGSVVSTSNQKSFSYTFALAGTYIVELTATNCRGSDTASITFEVVEQVRPSGYVVPAVAHSDGSNGSLWKTDLRLFNPSDDPVTVEMSLIPTGGTGRLSVRLTLGALETRIVPDVVRYIVPAGSDDMQGALRFDVVSPEDGAPIIMSRTFNDTPQGTYGQFIPAVPIFLGQHPVPLLTGLSENAEYRTNVGVTNLGDNWLGEVELTLLGADGAELAQTSIAVPAGSTKQFSARQLFSTAVENMDVFSVRVDAGADSDIGAYASVVHNVSNDPVLFLATSFTDHRQVVPGVAHLFGENGSSWRTDLGLMNPNPGTTDVTVTYVPDRAENWGRTFSETVTLFGGESMLLNDLLRGWIVSEDGTTKGYLLVDSPEEALPPILSARTYTREGNVVFGQGIVAVDASTLIEAGETVYVPGVVNSPDFRSNIGLLDVSDTTESWIGIRLYDTQGQLHAEKSLRLVPNDFRQLNLMTLLDLDPGETVEGSLEIEVGSGGQVYAYASVIDNHTNDPILIPVLRAQ